MDRISKSSIVFGLWVVLAVLLGSVLMSYHQPFLAPRDGLLGLAGPGDGVHWRAVHFLSGSCGCSQRVMRHLLQRGPLNGVAEQVLLLDGSEPYLPGSENLLRELQRRGFAVAHLPTRAIPPETKLRGVPLLIYANPKDRPAYVGGYGMEQDGDLAIYRQVRTGAQPQSLAILGCAVGAAVRRTADPFGLKY